MGKTGGRPTVISDEVVRKLEQAFRDGLSVSEACSTSGIGKTTYYERKTSDEGFTVKMELAKQYVTIKAKKTVVTAISSGDLAASKWWLERKARNEFGQHPVDEDDEYNKQSGTSADHTAILQILESMGAAPSDKAPRSLSPHHTALRVISEGLTALEPTDEHKAITEPAIVQVTTSSDDVLADLYDGD